jgi:hypothetical protein
MHSNCRWSWNLTSKCVSRVPLHKLKIWAKGILLVLKDTAHNVYITNCWNMTPLLPPLLPPPPPPPPHSQLAESPYLFLDLPPCNYFDYACMKEPLLGHQLQSADAINDHHATLAQWLQYCNCSVCFIKRKCVDLGGEYVKDKCTNIVTYLY